MNTKAKEFRAKRLGRKKRPFTAGVDSLSASSERRRRHSNQSQPDPERQPALDERVPALLLDAISSVQAVIASASMRLPYGEVRQSTAVSEEQKRQLTHAIREVAEKYPAFFTQNKAAIDFSVAWAAVHAAHFDNLFALTDRTNTGEEPCCSRGDALLAGLLVLGPLLIFAVVSIVHHLRRV